jgi:NAD(P)-dependent dehydrogenase (short-subunit alcohol dehydrogenase family)
MSTPKPLDILITGAGRGIGLELARQLAARGHRVVGTVRDARGLDALGAAGIPGETLDVQSDASVAALAERRADAPLDVLVNNAGLGAWTSLEGTTSAEMLQLFDVNAVGPLRVSRALLVPLRRSRGRMFHLTSKMGSIGDGPSGGSYAYRMSKAALNMASANLAAELRGAGIASIVVHPGLGADGHGRARGAPDGRDLRRRARRAHRNARAGVDGAVSQLRRESDPLVRRRLRPCRRRSPSAGSRGRRHSRGARRCRSRPAGRRPTGAP